MKYLFFLIIPFLLINCSNNNEVYWCGDHACVNKKEKKFYFKEKMIVEKRLVKKEDKLNKNEKNEIMKMIRVKEKSKSKKRKKQKKKTLVSKKAVKETIEHESSINQEDLSKKVSSEDKNIISTKNIQKTSEFNELVEKITKRSISKPYPDINNIQN